MRTSERQWRNATKQLLRLLHSQNNYQEDIWWRNFVIVNSGLLDKLYSCFLLLWLLTLIVYKKGKRHCIWLWCNITTCTRRAGFRFSFTFCPRRKSLSFKGKFSEHFKSGWTVFMFPDIVNSAFRDDLHSQKYNSFHGTLTKSSIHIYFLNFDTVTTKYEPLG